MDVRRGALFAITVALALSAGVTRIRRVAAWRQERLAATPAGISLHAEDVVLQSTVGSDLHVWWVPGPSEPAPAVVLVHGFASHAGDLLPVAPLLRAAGFHVLLLDLRGHGRSAASGGRPRPPEFAHDVRVAIDWLDARSDVTSVGLVGHSMGGSTAILAASQDERVRAVVSVAGVADPTLTRIGVWPAWISRLLLATVARRHGVDPAETFAVRRLAEVEAPVLLIHGARDRVVPIRHSHRLRQVRPDVELVTVAGAGHASFERFGPAMGRAVDFLRQHLG